ncbi:MAG: SurA N-terminal domain-containing protein [Akkermansiaceae bacterium]
MIENLRKYTGLIIVLFVLVIIGFIFLDSSTIRASSGGAPILKVAGRNYSEKEFRKLGSSSYELTQALAQSGDFQLYTFLFSLAGNPQDQDEAQENFFVNRMILRSAKEEFGIYPGEEEIDSFIRQLRLFTGPDGAFSQEAYRNFIEKGIGRLGLTEGDIRELTADVLTHRKLTEILGSGLDSDRGVIAKNAAIEEQRISADIARIDRDPIEAKIDPSEEEINTYWETVKDAFKTPEKRRFTYVIAKPTIPEEPAEIAPLAEDATNEQKAEHATKVAERAAKIEEGNRAARLETGGKANKFYDSLMNDEKATFEELARTEGFEIATTELFAPADAPEPLKAPLRGSSAQSNVTAELFKINVTSDRLSKFSSFLAAGENEWIIARLDETEESRTQTYEEARADARARLIAEKTATALQDAAKEAVTKIETLITEGKSFKDAAKEAGIENETVSLPDVTRMSRPDTANAPGNLFDAVKYTEVGKLAEPILEADRAFIVHVASREIVQNEAFETMVDSQLEQAAESNRIATFESWLNTKVEAADVQQLYRQR